MNGPITWHNPWALILLLVVVPLLIALALLQRRRAAALRFPLTGLLMPGPRGMARFYWLVPACRILAVILAIVALARPQVRGNRARDLSVEGIDIVVALDVSTSMNAVDFRPKDRISVAKEVLKNFIAQRNNDRIGLVVFARDAYTQAPLTLDYHVLTQILGSVRTGLIDDGTAIGNALGTTINRLCENSSSENFCKSGAKSKVAILITDGDNNSGNISPMQAASLAKEYGIRVYTIMVGKGGRVPFPAGPDFFGNTSFQEVEIPVNPELLKAIANQTGGNFYTAVDRESLESGLTDILNQLEKSKLYQAGGFENMTEVFEPFLLGAALCLLLEILLSSTRLRSFS